MQTIKRHDLLEWILAGRPVTIVEVLPRDKFREFHLPNAISVPLDENFDEQVQQAVPDKITPVVVYCQNAACPASSEAARRLDALGYEDVFDYVEGKADWANAGLRTDKALAAR